MKFELTIHDRNGVQLNEGDIVKISDGKNITFYSEVKYLEEERVITPLHTFSFMSIQKVDEVPSEATKSTETRYNIWYLPIEKADDNSFNEYLRSWRECEYRLESRAYQITKI
jgi:hypothetical protein